MVYDAADAPSQRQARLTIPGAGWPPRRGCSRVLLPPIRLSPVQPARPPLRHLNGASAGAVRGDPRSRPAPSSKPSLASEDGEARSSDATSRSTCSVVIMGRVVRRRSACQSGGYRASHDRGAVTVGNEAPLTRPDPLRHFADLRRALTHYARQLARDIDAGRHPPTETLSRARSGAHPPTQALMSVVGEGGQSGASDLGG